MWFIQTHKSRAEKVKAQMAFIGIESIIQTSKNGASTWHKVALGPYTKKRMAEKDIHMLKNNKITGCQIWLPALSALLPQKDKQG